MRRCDAHDGTIRADCTAARSFVTQSHNTIGLVLCDRSMASPGYAEIAGAVECRAREAGLKLQLSLCESSQLGDDQLPPPIFQDDGIDGVVLTGDAPDWLLQRLSRWRMPFVLLGSQAGRTGVTRSPATPSTAADS